VNANKPAHSPTPWSVGKYVPELVRDAKDNGVASCARLGDGNEEANAAHIVRCVNAHDALVAALKECFGYVKSDYEGRHGYIGDAAHVVTRADAALKLAGEEVKP
jgi:hypothetical protein